MDRRRAAAALLALAACIACSAAAPTSSDNTDLDLYEGTTATEGCYYNFQHYGEGDRIMTNEPCLNCTCHNRMLMCYLRVCPFTKAIGQDCTVEKRADQCCPIVTCPDVPVDLLTSTSTTSPAEYGATGLGKVDNYGCTINGKYFAEGAKVPPTPNKPCEHCYCIRNMTTCVMQECTLHVDGCTPIYHKDVCCPVRYFCDHPEDEMPLLDDMTTTVRPTPGFLLTTTTEEAVTQTQKRECIENDQLYPDGALIKTEKPCVHCYCMKGDIVCVVQECGTPMENEGKNCTSLPPREGQCCPDTYICEGDELTTELATETPYEPLTTLQPPRRSGVEGSGYRNEPDEIAYTEIPSFVSEIEGSGDEPGTETPLDSNALYTPEKEATEETTDDRFAPTEVVDQYSSIVTTAPLSEDSEKPTTEPDRGLNTVEEEISEPSITENTTPKEETKVTKPATVIEQDMVTSEITTEESSKPTLLEETTTKDETKASDRPLISEPSIQDITTQMDESEPTEPTNISEQETTFSDTAEGTSTEPSILKLTTLSEDIQATVQPTTEKNTVSDEKEQESSDLSVIDKITQRYELTTDSKQESVPSTTESFTFESTKIPPRDEAEVTVPTATSEQQTAFSQMTEDESSKPEKTTASEAIASTEPAIISGENTIPIELEKESSAPSEDKTTPKYDMRPTIISEHITAPGEIVEDGTEPSVDMSTIKDETKLTESTVSHDKQPTTVKEDETITTEPTYRKEDEDKVLTDTTSESEVEKLTTAAPDFSKETAVTSEYSEVSSVETIAPPTDYEHKLTTTQSPGQQQGIEETSQSILEVSDVTKPTEESATTATTSSVTSEVVFTSPSDEKQELPVGTTINPEDNEIGEDISPPGRIPGEGDCLLNGITYRNDSSIPSNNKCHSGCKCVSSIVKCDPIICSPQPEYMDNCQPIYDTPESCCPTYVCDDSRETIPPQSHSQMSGTESPQPSPSIECDGDQCKVGQDKQSPSIPTQLCNSGDCDDVAQKPIKPYPSTEYSEGCTDGECKPTKDVPELTPVEPVGVPQACDNPENCKETHIPDIVTSPCEGESCINVKDERCDKNSDCEVAHDKPCEGQNCESKPDTTADKDTPEICKNQDDCKETKMPEIVVSPCEGESCIGITNESCDSSDCKEPAPKPCVGQNCEIQPGTTSQICKNQDDCKETEIPEGAVTPCEGESCTEGIKKPSQPSDNDELCSEEKGCKKPEDKFVQECADELCRRKQTSDVEHKLPSECNDPECLQKPIHPSQETTINVQLGTELPITSEPISEAGESVTEHDDQEIKLPESPVTQGQETYTEIPLAPMTAESVTIQPEQTGTVKPYKFSELPESTVGETEEASTRIPEEMTTKALEIATEHHEHIDTEHKLPETSTQESKLVTQPKTEEENTEFSEIGVTEKEDQATEYPSVSVTEISLEMESSSKPAEQGTISTESSKITESEAIYTIKTDEPVTEIKETSTMPSPHATERNEIPEPHVTESAEITHAIEVSDVEPEKTTGTPEHVTEHITSQFSEITTKSPLIITDQEVKTEVQTMATELPESPVVSSEPEIEPTGIEPHEIDSSTDRPHISDTPDDIATKIQETSTESLEEHELSTPAPLAETVSYEHHTELPKTTAFENEMQTKLPTRRVTAPEEYLTNVPYEDIDTQKSTVMPGSIGTEEDIETSTPSASTSIDDESKTKPYETDEKGVTTVEESLPQAHVTPPQEVIPSLTEKTVQQQESYTELPVSLTTGSEAYESKTPVVSMDEENKIQTDSPILKQTTLSPTSEQNETQTDLPTKESEPSVLEEETKTEIPEPYTTEPEKKITETPDQHMTIQEEGSTISDQPESDEKEHLSVVSTESPQSIVTDQDMGIGTLVTEQQATDESEVTEKEEIRTEVPMPSFAEDEKVTEVSPLVTEKDEIDENKIMGTDRITPSETDSSYKPSHEEASSEIPVSLFSEKEYTDKMTEVGESSVTESTLTPKQPEEHEIHTDLPIYVSTEQHELDTNGPENIKTEQPELWTETPATVSTDSHEKSTKIPSQTEIQETVTKLPEFSLTEEIPSSPDIEPLTFTTQEPSDIVHMKETTERVETITSDRALTTESPAVFVPQQEPVTESVSHETVQEVIMKEITKSPEAIITEHEELATTKSPVPNVTELEEIITQAPYAPESHTSETDFTVSPVTQQEIETKAPEKQYTEPQEFEIKSEEPSVTQSSDLPPAKETELPETGTVPQKSHTEYHETPTTDQSMIATKPSHKHEESHTEVPVFSVTETEEVGTKQPAATEQQELDQNEPKPTEILHTESPEFTEISIDITTKSPISELTQEFTKLTVEPEQTTKFSHEYSETTPYLVELEEHPHKVDEEISTTLPSEEPTTAHSEVHETEQVQQVTDASTEKLPSEEILTESPIKDTQRPYDEKEEISPPIQETSRPDLYPTTSEETPEKSTESLPIEEPSGPEGHLSTVAAEETPDKSSESTPVEEARPELHQTTLATEETPEMPTEPTSVEEPSKPEVYQTTSVSEDTTDKSSEPTSVEEPSKQEVDQSSLAPEIPEKSSESSILAEESTSSRPALSDSEEPDRRFSNETQTDRDSATSTSVQSFEEDKQTTPTISPDIEKTSIPGEDYGAQTEKDIVPSTSKPLETDVVLETTAPEDEFIPAKTTTAKIEEKDSTQSPEILDKFNKPEEKPSEPSTPTPETPKPGFNELQPTDEVPSPEDESHFPPSGGYGQEPDYVEEDQAFGPGTCRYGGKVYVSAQQIPRDDPCDFCFCFRSDIICLQQSCPPPIHGCHEEPIQGFCCPRYECPVSMATTLNVTTTTTTTTTTLPPHFLPHAYKGAAQRRGCQIKGHTYKVGEVVRASSGPCLHCTCGGDGQMKCDPKVCTPEPMLRQMIAAAVSSKRRR